MLRAGADLIQLYTSLVYEGPFLARAIVRGLSRELDADGAQTLHDLVATKPKTNGATHGGAVLS
jgi:dihydroorotate dehydrogenase